jgi:HK97 family phage major capsid protein
MNRDEIRHRMSQVVGELERIAQYDQPTQAQQRTVEVLSEEYDGLEGELKTLSLAELQRAANGGGGYRLEGSSPHTRPQGPQRDTVFRAAETAIATANRSGLLPDHAAQTATGLLERGPQRDRTLAARWAAAAGSEAYLRAFAATVIDPVRGHLTWGPEEQAAYRDAELVSSELRAMSLTDSAGGYMVPFSLDPSIMLTNSGVTSPLRQRARVETIVTDSWNGVTSAGVTSEWLPEANEAAAVTPALAQPSVPVQKLSTYVEYSIEVGMDAVRFVQELQRIMLDSAMQTAETAYTTGSGSNQPVGLITKLASVGGSSVVAPTSAEAFAVSDVYKVQNSLGPRFQPNASWLMSLAFINQCSQFETGNGALVFPDIPGGSLLRRPIDELSTMDSVINPAAVENNYVAVYGDLKAGFLIVDRIGATFETVQHVLGTNRRPTGQRGAWLYQRTGSDVVNPNALRLLSIPTS